MDTPVAGPSPVGLEKSFRLPVPLASAALLALLASAAHADDMIMGNMTFSLIAIGVALVIAVLAALAFTVVVCFLEGYVMDRVLRLGFRRCFWYAVVANVVSMGLGLVWYYAGGQIGWKTALIRGLYGSVAVLILRSFVITLAEETVVVLLLVRGQRTPAAVLKAMTAANLASYALLAVIVGLITTGRPA